MHTHANQACAKSHLQRALENLLNCPRPSTEASPRHATQGLQALDLARSPEITTEQGSTPRLTIMGSATRIEGPSQNADRCQTKNPKLFRSQDPGLSTGIIKANSSVWKLNFKHHTNMWKTWKAKSRITVQKNHTTRCTVNRTPNTIQLAWDSRATMKSRKARKIPDDLHNFSIASEDKNLKPSGRWSIFLAQVAAGWKASECSEKRRNKW